MTLVQKNINNKQYYTDDVNYYTFHVVGLKPEPLYEFACRDLGITKRSGFTQDEETRINDLAGTGAGVQQKTKYLLLKNGQAVTVPYHNIGKADLHAGDILLRKVSHPSAAGLIKCPHCESDTPPGTNCKVCGWQLTS